MFKFFAPIGGFAAGFAAAWVLQDRRFLKMLEEELFSFKEDVVGSLDHFVGL